jgi:hypothetical protein
MFHSLRLALFVLFGFFLGAAVLPGAAWADDPRCPGADSPPPPVLKVDLPQLISELEKLKDTQDRPVWKTTDETKAELKDIFESVPPKTKLEQFFRLMFLIQKNVEEKDFPMVVAPPGITQVLLTAKVFTDPSFPQKITRVELRHDDPNRQPLYTVEFSASEVRFPINGGKGFVTWESGMCQVAKELVFYNGFSFRVRPNRVNPNLVVDDFDRVELYGTFGNRGVFDIDLNYVELQKVEFIKGTDEGKVKAKVAKREFQENKHSSLFKFIGTLIPNTSKQRIDW